MLGFGVWGLGIQGFGCTFRLRASKTPLYVVLQPDCDHVSRLKGRYFGCNYAERPSRVEEVSGRRVLGSGALSPTFRVRGT